MDPEPWQIFTLAAVVLAIYGLGVGLGASASAFGLLVVAGFVVAGLLLGRTISGRFFE